ncbi:MAG TPA: hypothetical protein VND91_08100, partial [Candidatus Saccharimonadia bacterium]|nr:hypothetical protein [Candidatus Saccharimonadia bacterium]
PPQSTWAAGLRWHEVLGHTLLGERERAFAALQRGVARGHSAGVTWLDHDPLYAPMRADPRYEKTIAPARARAAAEVQRARDAGLL